MKRKDDYSPQFKAQVVMRLLRSKENICDLEKKYNISAGLLEEWKEKLIKDAATVFRYVSYGVDEEKEDVNDEYMVKIRQLRLNCGYSQKEIAEFLGVAQNMYARYENGRNQMPVRFVKKLALFYGVTTDYMLGIETKQEQENDNESGELYT